MSKVCEITGKKPAVAMNVSHAQNKTKRRQLPNLQVKKFMSEILNRDVRLRVSASAIRTIDKYGGIDQFMMGYKKHDVFSKTASKIRKAIKALAPVEASVETTEAKTKEAA